ncbi:MAG TPA: helix-turn-helix transcriptional regulator [Vineibacter sp.]|nr:helix-turn-helix transcriptional regulator [Vineibacter sp.]
MKGRRATTRADEDDEGIIASSALARMILAKKVNDIMAQRKLTQTEAARVLGIPQSKVSFIQNYKLKGISLERLMLALAALGQNVEIVVRPGVANRPARLYVDPGTPVVRD